MTELNKKQNTARLISDRAFLKQLHFRPPSLKIQLTFWLLMVIGLALDLWSKWAVFNWLQQKSYNTFSIVDGFLQFVTGVNAGAAFGIASGQRLLLVTVSVLALIVVFAVFFCSGTKRKIVHIALGLFAAGICGNLWDRIFNDGLVRDFIDVYYRKYHWPAFNIADSMLCVAVGLLIISNLFTAKSYQKHVRQRK